MSFLENYDRCTRVLKCPVCGKPDWCVVAKDRATAICGRVPEGSVYYAGEAGWLHRLGSFAGRQTFATWRSSSAPAPQPETPVDAAELQRKYECAYHPDRAKLLARSLGLESWYSLAYYGLGWCDEKQLWTWPMKNEAGRVVGLRTRAHDGGKRTIKGTKSGLFMPHTPSERPSEPILIVEGPTDAAAGWELGYNAIGRPSCNQGNSMLVSLMRLSRQRIVIVADNDGPGLDGAYSLADQLHAYSRGVKVVRPIAGKDLREWYRSGLTPNILGAVIDNTPYWARRVAS